ncbi:MAG TPA: hypothetical protein ACFYD0_11250 [Candidatus Wunengus sp. YC65]
MSGELNKKEVMKYDKVVGKAFEEVSKLSEKEQNIVAKWLLEELAAERR